MKFLISGSSGLVGAYLLEDLRRRNEDITKLARPATTKTRADKNIEWDIQNKKINFKELEGFDTVIHLAGANISGHRWTKRYKKEIHDSRVDSTTFLTESLLQLEQPPRLVITASAMGYYGSHDPDEDLTEASRPGEGFLAGVCHDWEAAAAPLKDAGIRVAHLRFGVILGKEGGALAKMLPIFKAGLGGPIGSGRQIMSWISVKEIPDIIRHIVTEKHLSGPVNAVSPHPVSNREFTQTLAAVLRRPAVLPVPAFALRLALGEMADELLINGAKVLPDRLHRSGYTFRYAHLKPALADILGLS